MKKIILLLMFVAAPAWSASKVDYVNLGATLLKDGYLERANNVLKKVDVTSDDVDFSRYYTLKAILYHRMNYPLISNLFFSEAIDRGQANKSVHLYMARNYWQLSEYQKVVDKINQAGELGEENKQIYVIKAEAYKQLGNMEMAWQTLDHAIERFPSFARYYRQKFHYLLELGFYKHALGYAEKYLKVKNYDADDYLAIGYALRKQKQLDEAAVLLEEGVIRFGNNKKLIELLSRVYIDQQSYLKAALVYDKAAIEHPRFSHKAAALYLKANQPARSLQLNRRIGDQKNKFRQRLGIDIYLDDYESLVAKKAALERYGLLDEDSIIYALGYAYYRVGEFESAKKYLKQINDRQLFKKASHLFQQIDKCYASPLDCN